MNPRLHFAFLNVGHFIDHLLPLVFATAAALALTREWGMSYAQLIPYATPALVVFGLGALPAGWLADRWSREKMMVIFFFGIGASAMATALADTPLTMALGLFAIGVFGSIYHPVGLAMVIQGRSRTGIPLAINGMFGNLGVACAALFTSLLIGVSGWRAAFVWPGAIAVLLGVVYLTCLRYAQRGAVPNSEGNGVAKNLPAFTREMLIRVLIVVFVSTALGGLIFQSTTFALPKVIDERLTVSVTGVGWYVFSIFALASLGQLVVGYLVDRLPLKGVFLVVAAGQCLFALVLVGSSGISTVFASVAFMLVVFAQIPINDVLIGRFTSSEWRSRALAARYIITFSVSATAIPMIAWTHNNWGFDAFFLILAGVAITVFGFVYLLPRVEALQKTS
ncbi:MAG TPA: MFS transporter [Gammaproteobacteria bacterium]|nr:MFS transporter [Gammaproteobacteria bacterium]